MDIVITTFEARKDILIELINSIRTYVNNRIILIINGEKNGVINEDYRRDILNICLEHINIVPIFFTELRSLSKMWNIGVINSTSKNILILNDDLLWVNNLIKDIETQLDLINDVKLINHSFSHFIVNKTFMNEIGYFDEKLLGFGWEDSDFCMRYYEKTGNVIGVIETTAIKNLNSTIKHKNIRNVWDKYSLINREYYEKKYEYPLAKSYKCGQRFLPNENPYPLETHYLNNKNNL